MESSAHRSSSSVGSPFQAERTKKMSLREVVETYMLGSRSGLDGILHGALNVEDPRVRLDSRADNWMSTKHQSKETLIESNERNSIGNIEEEVDGEETRFLAAIKEYNTMVQGSKHKPPIDMSQKHTIEEVLVEVVKAQQLYSQVDDQSGHWRRVRLKLKGIIGNHNPAYESWLNLLPKESHYLSIVWGGMKLIIGIAARLQKINAEIVDAICEIPSILNKNRRSLDVHRSSITLKKHSSTLYVSILDALGNILLYYQQHHRLVHVRRGVGAFFQQSSYKGSLIEKVEKIKACSDLIDAEIRLCDMELAKDTNRVSNMMNATVQDTQQRVNAIGDTMANDLNEIRLLMCASPRLRPIAWASMVSKGNYPSPSVETDIKERSSTEKPRKAKHSKIILSHLNFDASIPQEDVITNLDIGPGMLISDQDRAVFVMQSEVVQNWLLEPSSSLLLVNANDHHSTPELSSLNFVCAKIAHAVHQRSKSAEEELRIVELHFFCGAHADPREDQDHTPAGVLNSLLAQLLKQYKQFDLFKIRHLDKFDYRDVNSLHGLFRDLLHQLPQRAIVFCTIVGLSNFDEEDSRDDVETLLDRLVELERQMARKRDKYCVLKVLLAEPIELQMKATEKLMEEEVLSIPEVLEQGGGFTEMQWEMGLGQSVQDISLRKEVK